MNHVQIMAKPVCGRCNLACGYCYYVAKPRELYPDHPAPIMPDEVLREYIRQSMMIHPERADFCWQGGEPLLAGKDFFRKVVAYQQEFGRPGQIVGNALQTNGTLLDEEWCEFFRTYHFFLGISLDGPAQLHNLYRKDAAGRGSFDAVWWGVNLLNRYQIEFNVLTTLHAGNVHHGRDLYRFFVNRGIRYLQFIPLVEQNSKDEISEFSCSPEAFGRFMLEVLELWLKDGMGRISERFIDSVLNSLLTGQAGLCWNLPACPKAFVLEWNGDIYACDHFVTAVWQLGNLMTTPLTELAVSPVFEEFQKAKTILPQPCRACDYVTFCQGGCPKHHRGTSRTDSERINYFCPGYKLFFRQALPALEKIVRAMTSAPISKENHNF